jgi:5-oxoprolinase (ATP-hydrolysing) subunit A
VPRIDLNADVGEGFGAWAMGSDAELLALVTSANVACGFHAGDPAVMDHTVGLAVRAGVALGAHPGHADLRGFGRRAIQAAADDIEKDVLYQVGALQAFARAHGTRVVHVKPHGALYNQACRDRELADLFVIAAAQFHLPVVGLPGSALEAACADRVKFIAEGFADRRYRPDGSLVPRTEPNAFVDNPGEAVKQIEWLINDRHIQTICVHGDNPDAVAFTKAVRAALVARGFTFKYFV